MKTLSKITSQLVLIVVLSFFLSNCTASGTPSPAAPQATKTPLPATPTTTPTQVVPTATLTPTPVPISFSEAAEKGLIEEVKRFGIGQIYESEYSPDGSLIVYATSFGVYLFDPSRVVITEFIPASGEVKSVSFSPDGNWIAYGTTQGDVVIWDVKSQEEIVKLREHETAVEHMTFSPDGQFLVSSDESGRLNVFQTSDWTLLRTHELGFVYDMEFLPDGSKIFVSTHRKGVVSLDSKGWGILNQYSIVKILDRNYILSAEGIALSPDGKYMAVAMDRTIAIPIIELSSGVTHMLIPVDPALTDFETANSSRNSTDIYVVAISPDGKYLAFSGKGRTGLVDLEKGGELVKFQGKGGQYKAISFSPEGNRLVMGSVMVDLKKWEFESSIYLSPNLTKGTLVSVNPDDGRKVLKDESLFASGKWELETDTEEGTITLKKRGAKQPLFTSDAHTPMPFSAFGQTAYLAKIRAAAADDDSFFVTGGADKLLKLWTLTENPEPRLLGTLKGGVDEIAISPDARLIAVRDVDGRLYLFQSAGETAPVNLGSFGEADKIVFSPDSTLLAATVNTDHLIVWNLSSETPSIVFEADQSERFDKRPFDIDELVFSPDSKVLVSAGLGAPIDVWRAADGELLKELDNRTYVTRMQFSKDGTILYVDGQTDVRWWGVKQ
jgi:WD40 repeat protein